MRLSKEKFIEAVQEVNRRMFNEAMKGKKTVPEIYDEVHKKYVGTS